MDHDSPPPPPSPGDKVIFGLLKLPWYWQYICHLFQTWGQIWPPRLFGGCFGLGGCQKWPYYIINMHVYKLVIEVTDFKFDVGFDLWGCLEDVVASEAAKIQSYFYCPCRRRYLGPLPSCFATEWLYWLGQTSVSKDKATINRQY